MLGHAGTGRSARSSARSRFSREGNDRDRAPRGGSRWLYRGGRDGQHVAGQRQSRRDALHARACGIGSCDAADAGLGGDTGARRSGDGRLCRDGRGRCAAFFRRRNSDRRPGRVGQCDGTNRTPGLRDFIARRGPRAHGQRRGQRGRGLQTARRGRRAGDGRDRTHPARPGAGDRRRSAGPYRARLDRALARPHPRGPQARRAAHLRGHAASLRARRSRGAAMGSECQRWRRRCARRATSRRW